MPAVCDQTPERVVSPELINLAPGGTATVDVTLRNVCKDARVNDSDLLISLSDGLTVVGGSAGLVNLGQRAAWQSISPASVVEAAPAPAPAAAPIPAALPHTAGETAGSAWLPLAALLPAIVSVSLLLVRRRS